MDYLRPVVMTSATSLENATLQTSHLIVSKCEDASTPTPCQVSYVGLQ